MKKFSQALAWLTASEIIFNAAGYVIHSALGRILGPEDYGRYGLVVTLTTMIIMLIGNGIPTAMSKYLSEIFESAPEKILPIKRQAIRLQLIVMSIVTLLFFLACPLFAWALHDPSLTPLFRVSALIIPSFAAASFYFYYYTGLHFFRIQAVLKTLRSFARIGFIVVFAYYFGVSGAVSGYIAAPLAVFIAAVLIDIWVTHRYFPATKTKSGDASTLFSAATILRYAWPLTLFLLFYEFILTLDLYFVKALLRDDYLTGIYNAAITVGRIPYYLFYALTIILLPAVSKTLAEEKRGETEDLVNKALRLLVLLLFPLITLLIAYSPQVLALFYGAKYAAAAAPLNIFALGVGFLTVFYVLSFALNGAGLVKVPMWLSFFGLLGMIALNLLLIPRFGLVGAASSITGVSFFLMIGILVYTERHFHVRLSLRTTGLSVIASALTVFCAHFLPRGDWSFLFSSTLLFVGYFFFLYITRGLTREDLEPFAKLLKKKSA